MLTREERKRKLSEYGRKGAEARWREYHASIPAPDYHELPETCFEIEVRNLISGKTNVLAFHPGGTTWSSKTRLETLMPEHHSKHTTSVMYWCPKCANRTMHRVDNGRLGACLEPHFTGLSKKQEKAREQAEKERQQPGLF